MKAKTLALKTNNPRPWLWPLLLLAGGTLPILWLLPIAWNRSMTLGILVAFVALPGMALMGVVASWMFRWPQMLAYRTLHRRCLPSGRQLCCAGRRNQVVSGSIIVKSAL